MPSAKRAPLSQDQATTWAISQHIRAAPELYQPRSIQAPARGRLCLGKDFVEGPEACEKQDLLVAALLTGVMVDGSSPTPSLGSDCIVEPQGRTRP